MVLYFDASDACVQTSMLMSIFADRYTGVSRNSGPGKKPNKARAQDTKAIEFSLNAK